MSEPKRWLHDESAPSEVVDLLRAAHRPRSASAAKRMALVGVLAKVATESPRTAWWVGWIKAALYGLGVVIVVLAISAARGTAPARLAAQPKRDLVVAEPRDPGGVLAGSLSSDALADASTHRDGATAR
jgi:hypothetical protein